MSNVWVAAMSRSCSHVPEPIAEYSNPVRRYRAGRPGSVQGGKTAGLAAATQQPGAGHGIFSQTLPYRVGCARHTPGALVVGIREQRRLTGACRLEPADADSQEPYPAAREADALPE